LLKFVEGHVGIALIDRCLDRSSRLAFFGLDCFVSGANYL
jgi:hypothetical protein